MRHIPEDELHAYLDQGLSRSQCVEIESHLAACASCQAARDGIAALRDRTTALLARLAPPRSFPTQFETLRRRADLQVSARRRRAHLLAWAASIVAAVAFGWTANYLTNQGPVRMASGVPAAAPASVARQAVTKDSRTPTTTPAILPPMTTDSTRARVRRRPPQVTVRSPSTEAGRVSLIPAVSAATELELTSIDIPPAGHEFELDGMWRTMSWAGAQAEAGDKLPHIDGLPVVQVQVQAGEQGRQPLMVVAQQLSSGEVIRTIEGPAQDVSHLLARRTMSDPVPTVSSVDSSRESPARPERVDGSMAMQRGDRMIAITGALPPDSLLAMIRRLNAEMRSK
ncbi:MAG: anti-sigma factor family protein [Gemmatimonadales bacterium]